MPKTSSRVIDPGVRRLICRFEGGSIYEAEDGGKFLLVVDQGTLLDLLNEEDRAGFEPVIVYEFETLADRKSYLGQLGWAFPIPSARDQADFLFRLYFGAGRDDLTRAARRAYQDLGRTVHGIGAYPEARPRAEEALRTELAALPGRGDITTQNLFDMWHEAVCHKLSEAYKHAGYPNFYVGQSQKWLNMALKYIYVFGEARLPGYAKFYQFCHVPIDNIVLRTSEFRELAPFHDAWSRITDYANYLAFQTAVRNRYPNSPPLAIEFWSWQRNHAP